MSREELLAALRRDAEAALDEVRAAIARDEAAMRATSELQLAELRAGEGAALGQLAAGEAAALVGAAQRGAQQTRLLAEEALAGRLLALAGGLLTELAVAGGSELWQRLADEVPAGSWTRVVVHPRDAASARARFPQATIDTDSDCSGGLLVEDAGGRVRIDNRLNRRLNRGWDDLLPLVWHDPRLRAGRGE